MTPVQSEPLPAPVTSVDVAVAVLTEKVTQVIGDHERRISALENRRDTVATRGASIMTPFLAGAAVFIALADKIRWQ